MSKEQLLNLFMGSVGRQMSAYSNEAALDVVYWSLFNFCVSFVPQCQGVSGIIIVTMVTSFMLVYISSSGDRSPSSLASSSSTLRLDDPVSSTKMPERQQRPPKSKLEGYTGVMDYKVNVH